MAIATVYVIKDNQIIREFDMEYENAIRSYWGKSGYYVAKKGIKVPFQHQMAELKDVHPQGQNH